MELIYTLDPNALEPIILVHGDIGYENGTIGDQFTKELMFLDTLNKTRIQVWINSGRGVVTDGEQICNAILKSKTPVDTYNTGTCASIAYPIFACGRKRYMMDWAKNMFHNPFGGDEKSLEAFKKTILTIIIQRSNGKLTEAKMSEIMDKETWIMAEESLKLGLCDEIENSATYNKAEAVMNRHNYNKVLNQLKTKTKIYNMEKVYNKLNLVSGSTEDAILNAIAKIENQAKFDKEELEKCKAEFEKVEKDYIETKAKYDSLQAKFQDMENKAQDAAKAIIKAEAETEISAAVKAGKIENKAESIEAFTNKYIADPKGTKEILNAIKGTVESADLGRQNNGGTPKVWNAVSVMNAVKANLKK